MTNIMTTAYSLRKQLLAQVCKFEVCVLHSRASTNWLILLSAGSVANLTQPWTWSSSALPHHFPLLKSWLILQWVLGPSISSYINLHVSFVTVITQPPECWLAKQPSPSLIRLKARWVQKSPLTTVGRELNAVYLQYLHCDCIEKRKGPSVSSAASLHH